MQHIVAHISTYSRSCMTLMSAVHAVLQRTVHCSVHGRAWAKQGRETFQHHSKREKGFWGPTGQVPCACSGSFGASAIEVLHVVMIHSMLCMLLPLPLLLILRAGPGCVYRGYCGSAAAAARSARGAGKCSMAATLGTGRRTPLPLPVLMCENYLLSLERAAVTRAVSGQLLFAEAPHCSRHHCATVLQMPCIALRLEMYCRCCALHVCRQR
jgi:hypothetical protein